MTRRLEWSGPAASDMRRLDRKAAARVRDALVRLAETGHGDVKKLKGAKSEWRLRVGSYRVLFTYADASATIQVLHVWPRGSAYPD